MVPYVHTYISSNGTAAAAAVNVKTQHLSCNWLPIGRQKIYELTVGDSVLQLRQLRVTEGFL